MCHRYLSPVTQGNAGRVSGCPGLVASEPGYQADNSCATASAMLPDLVRLPGGAPSTVRCSRGRRAMPGPALIVTVRSAFLLLEREHCSAEIGTHMPI